MKDFLQLALSYRDVFLTIISCFGAAFIWRYHDRKPYVKAALIEDFKTERLSDPAFDRNGDILAFDSHQYRLRLTIYPTTCRSELCLLTASSGKLCPASDWMYREGEERQRSLPIHVVIDPSNINPKPTIVEFQFLPDEDIKAVRFTMRLNRRLFPSVPVHVDFIGGQGNKKAPGSAEGCL